MERDINSFLLYLAREKGCSRNTSAAYRNDLSQLAAYIEREKTKGLLNSQNEFLKGYLLDLREKRYSTATVARKIAAAKSFFKFMINSGRLKENPMEHLMSPQVGKHRIKFLSPTEYQSLLAQPTKMSTPEARRDVVMLELLYFTGLRVSEMVSLNVDDVDFKRACLHCTYGTANREAPFDLRISQLLRNFIEGGRLDLLFDDDEEALFLNLRGKRLTRQGFWQIIKNYAARAGLSNEVTPQALRHSFAMRKLQSGIDLHSLQQLLGHSYVSSTKVYEQSSFRMR